MSFVVATLSWSKCKPLPLLLNQSVLIMKKGVVVVLLLVAQLIQAQVNQPDFNINWGEELKQPNNAQLTEIIANTSEGLYALRTKMGNSPDQVKVYIELYNQEMKLDKVRELDLKYNKKTRKFEQIVRLNNEFYLLTSFHNKAQKINYIFKQRINKDRLTISDRDIEMIGSFATKNLIREGNFDIIQSKDSSKLLLFHQLPYQKGTPERFKLSVFNEQFEALWTNDIVLPYNDEVFSVEDYRVDRNGNVYLLGKVYQDKARVSRGGRPNYQYVILAYTEEGDKSDEYRISLKQDFITDLTFRVANNGDLICSGFYSEKGTTSIKGTYFFRVNATTKELYNQNQKAFDFDFLTEFYTDRQKEKAKRAERSGNTNKEPELYRFALDDLILRSDGGALMIAEQYYIFERSYRDFWYGTFRSDFFYHYNDIIVVNIRPDGTIEWATRIPKQQVTVNDNGYYSSYAMSIVRDKIYLIFNDNRRNFELNNRNRVYNFDGRNSIVALVEISLDGAWDISPLFPNRDINLVTRPKVSRQIDRSTMAVYGELGRQFRFGKLEFKR